MNIRGMDMKIDPGVINHNLSSLSSAQPVVNDEQKQQETSNVSKKYTSELSELVVDDKDLSNATKATEDKVVQKQLPKEQLEVLAEKLQDFVGSLNKGLEFSVHEDSGRDVIKVIDRDTKEVVRQYPSEEVLELVAKLSDAAGNFINSKV
jgi:flagellar protein FlaG